MTMSELMPNTELKELREKAASRIYVVAGIIQNKNREVLIAKRRTHQHQGGLWEFPGGKKEAEESAFQALNRELNEELGIKVGEAIPFKQVEHNYSDKNVFLDFWLVQSYTGILSGVEGQSIAWVPLANLKQFEFPAANVPVVDALLETLC